MRRVLAVLFTFALVVAACGGDDDDDVGATTGETPAQTSEGDTDDGDMADPPESPVVDEAMDDEAMDDDEDDDPVTVGGFDEIPAVCRDLMEQFLKDIEPIVAPIDWDNATINDFETIAAQFDPIADDFDVATEATGQCDDIELDDAENFALLLDFAAQVAPGTVGFLSFLDDFTSGVGATSDDDGDGLGSGDAAFDDCAGAVSWLMTLVAEYDSVAEVPVSDVLEISGLGAVVGTCTPEQLEYIQSPEVQDFLAAG